MILFSKEDGDYILMDSEDGSHNETISVFNKVTLVFLTRGASAAEKCLRMCVCESVCVSALFILSQFHKC